MSVTPSGVRVAHTTPANEPLVAIDALALERPLTPIATVASLGALAEAIATTDAARTMPVTFDRFRCIHVFPRCLDDGP